MKFIWECINGDPVTEVAVTERAKVFGGWVVRSTMFFEDKTMASESMVFVPDPAHDWEIEE